jgi:hypothetical protein
MESRAPPRMEPSAGVPISLKPTRFAVTTGARRTLQVLLAFPGQEVGVYYCSAASDAPGYAQDFVTIFKAIGWKVNEEATSESLSEEFTGLAFVATGPDSLPPVAEALRDVLRIYEIEVGTLSDPTCNMRSSGFILSVGPPASSNFEQNRAS